MGNGQKRFFDRKKDDVVVASGATPDDAAIASSCCTLSSEATCGDWDGHGNIRCPAGQVVKPTTVAAADTTDGLQIKAATFNNNCCGQAFSCDAVTAVCGGDACGGDASTLSMVAAMIAIAAL